MWAILSKLPKPKATQRRGCASQTVANKTLQSGKNSGREWCLTTQEMQWYESYSEKLKVSRNNKVFETFEFWNDICTRGKPLHELFNDIGVDQIAGETFFKFMLIYAKIFGRKKFFHFLVSKYPNIIFLWRLHHKIWFTRIFYHSHRKSHCCNLKFNLTLRLSPQFSYVIYDFCHLLLLLPIKNKKRLLEVSIKTTSPFNYSPKP